MKEKTTLSLLFRRIKLRSSMLLLLAVAYCTSMVKAQGTVCNDTRQFYTKFCHQSDTSVFITSNLFESARCLYGMSAADKNGNEIDCKVVSFKFILMRNDSVLYTHQYDTMTLTTLDTLRASIKRYEVTQGDILIFTNIRVKHPSTKPCYHASVPMLKVIDNYRTYPRRMYMDVSKQLDKSKK